MKSSFYLIIFFSIIGYSTANADNYEVEELKKRVYILESRVKDLEKIVMPRINYQQIKKLKTGMRKWQVEDRLGTPNIVGKLSNGYEIWGFSETTLKFDEMGKLSHWTK